MHVHFVLAGEANLDSLRQLDPDLHWREFITGERAWVLQTFLRLRSSGLPVSLSACLPETGIAIFSAKDRRRLLSAQKFARPRALLVAIREDVGRTPFADVEIVQNPSQLRGDRTMFMPFWPQPGLLPRDAGRGDSLRQIAFKGYSGNLHPSFRSPAWHEFVASRRLVWHADAVDYARTRTSSERICWNDFTTTDLVVAVRPDDPSLHPRKPATKLYNAWLAGVPAILGPEIAYRAMRMDDLDYIEVRDSSGAMQAIDALLEHRQRYRAMIARAAQRAREFSTAAFVERWRRLVEMEFPRLAGLGRPNRKPLWLRQLAGRIAGAH
jgi:hypothetical protein